MERMFLRGPRMVRPRGWPAVYEWNDSGTMGERDIVSMMFAEEFL